MSHVPHSYTVEKAAIDLQEALRIAETSNVDPTDLERIAQRQRWLIQEALEKARHSGPSGEANIDDYHGFCRGLDSGIELAAQHVEAQHCVWDHTGFPVAHVIQTLANGIRALMRHAATPSPIEKEKPCS